MTRHANFRRTYYKTLGVPVRKSVEVEESFATALCEDAASPSSVINIAQLIHLTLEFGLPQMYRTSAWSVVCQIVPLLRDAEADTWKFARMEKAKIFEDLVGVAEACQIHLHDVSPCQRLVNIHRFYVEEVRPNLRPPKKPEPTKGEKGEKVVPAEEVKVEVRQEWLTKDRQAMQAVASVIQSVMEDSSEQFWCLVAFVDILDRGFKSLQSPANQSQLYDLTPMALERFVFRILAVELAKAATTT